MTNTELKNNIDAAITNKTAIRSITPANVGEQIKSTVDYIDQEISSIELTPGPQGEQGTQGIQGEIGLQGPVGPQGVAGPVGPAGLNWQGVWVSGTSYIIDDAVGYNGASWFCINPTSGTTSPDLDTSNWALLAAQGSPGPQGAQGVQGIQGPTGPQGPAGPSGTAPTATQGLVTASSSFPYPVLINSLNQVLATADNNSRVVLPTSTAIVGQKVVVSCIGGHKLLVKASQAGGGIYINGVNNDLVNEFYIYPNETYEFTYNDNAEWISYFEEPKAKYKSYVIKVITGASLTTYVLENTLDAVVTVTKDLTSIVLTCDAPIFLYLKTHIISSSYNMYGLSFITYPTIVSDTEIRINSFKGDGTGGMAFGAEVYIELRVYN